jgi:hypothetical protein
VTGATGTTGPTALLAGGSGLVGGLAIPRLLAAGAFARVVSFGRRLVPRLSGGPRLLRLRG